MHFLQLGFHLVLCVVYGLIKEKGNGEGFLCNVCNIDDQTDKINSLRRCESEIEPANLLLWSDEQTNECTSVPPPGTQQKVKIKYKQVPEWLVTRCLAPGHVRVLSCCFFACSTDWWYFSVSISCRRAAWNEREREREREKSVAKSVYIWFLPKILRKRDCPRLWLSTKADSNATHRAGCSASVQAHKELTTAAESLTVSTCSHSGAKERRCSYFPKSSHLIFYFLFFCSYFSKSSYLIPRDEQMIHAHARHARARKSVESIENGALVALKCNRHHKKKYNKKNPGPISPRCVPVKLQNCS